MRMLERQPAEALTHGPAAHYPLYYFVPSHTSDERWMVVHREEHGMVQLVRLDLPTGDWQPITSGKTAESGWALWCRPDVGGIYDHLSAVNPVRGEVYWFEDGPGGGGDLEIRAAVIQTLERRLIARLPGRIPMGQSAFSPDGRWFALIHADHDQYRACARGRSPGDHDHQSWRESTPVELSLIDTHTGRCSKPLRLGVHVHHVLFADDAHLLINHQPGGNGMWIMAIDGTPESHILPQPRQPACRICHQVVTDRGIFYEAFEQWTGMHQTWVGKLTAGTYQSEFEYLLPLRGYVHTGRDPAGRQLFYEIAGESHGLYLFDPAKAGHPDALSLLRRLPPYPGLGQRYHAHPFLGPTRQWMYFTEVVDGRSQVMRMSRPPTGEPAVGAE